MFHKRTALLIVLIVAAFSASAESRVWKDASGKHSTEASLLECKGRVAYLQKSNGKIAGVPLARLSQDDRNFLADALQPPNVIAGKVISVTDGETLIVVDESKAKHRISLAGIDCPKSSHAYGKKARKALAAKVFRKDVRVEWREKDKYGHTLGDVILHDRWINKELVAEGWAWHCKEESNSKVLALAETKARASRAGLWQDKKLTAARDSRRGPVGAKSTLRTETGGWDATVYITSTGKKYHREGCRSLKKSKTPIPLSQAVGKYSPCKVCKPQ